jgi:hypothetical protein
VEAERVNDERKLSYTVTKEKDLRAKEEDLRDEKKGLPTKGDAASRSAGPVLLSRGEGTCVTCTSEEAVGEMFTLLRAVSAFELSILRAIFHWKSGPRGRDCRGLCGVHTWTTWITATPPRSQITVRKGMRQVASRAQHRSRTGPETAQGENLASARQSLH